MTNSKHKTNPQPNPQSGPAPQLFARTPLPFQQPTAAHAGAPANAAPAGDDSPVAQLAAALRKRKLCKAGHEYPTIIKHDPATGRAAICPHCYAKHFKAVTATDRKRAAVAAKLRKSVANESKSDPHTPAPSGERWITVHPHGDDEKGVPVLVHEHHDGSWSIKGGAGGKLNGLRLTGLKSPEEYNDLGKQRAAQKSDQKREARGQQLEALQASHRKAVAQEAILSGKTLTPEAIDAEAKQRAAAEFKDNESRRDQAVAMLKDQRHQLERQKIETVAKAQGWQDYDLDEDALQKLRPAIEAQFRKREPDIKDNKLNKLVEARLQRLRDDHHAKLLARVREVRDNARKRIIAASDLGAKDLGDVAVGDLVKDTLGDSGQGYNGSLIEQARERGMEVPAPASTRSEAAQQTDADLDELKTKLAANGEHEAKIARLDASASSDDMAQHAQTLTAIKRIDEQLKAVQEQARDARDTDDIETLPKTAVLQAQPLSDEDAQRMVQHDLDEVRRQHAMNDLLHLYDAQDQASSLSQHRSAGNNAYFNNVGQLAGLRAPDPLTADALGASGVAHVMRRALELAAPDDEAKRLGIQEALALHHVDTQVGIANDATEHANELLNQAENLGDIPLDSVDNLMAAMNQAEQHNELVREAREHVGVALGRLEAGAALNEAFMRPAAAKELQVAMGAVGPHEAESMAYGMGLDTPDETDDAGNLIKEGQFAIHHDGHNAILHLHESGLDALAHQLLEDPRHLQRAAIVDAIKGGAQDEPGWLPSGFSPRPAVDISGGDGVALSPLELQLDIAGRTTPRAIAGAVQDNIAQRIEAGQDPTNIVSDLRSESFLNEHVPIEQQAAYRQAVEQVAPSFQLPAGIEAGKRGQLALDHKNRLSEMFRGYHNAYVDRTGLDSVHRQTLPLDWNTRDLAYQIALQDPHLQHAFTAPGALGRDGRKAVRDYAYAHIFKGPDGAALDPKDDDTPTQALSPDERAAWDKWRDLARDDDGKATDPYAKVQAHWKQHDEENSGGGLFGDGAQGAPAVHDFATVDLKDDAAVLAAARAHPDELGYKIEHQGDVKSGHYDAKAYPELESGVNRSDAVIANGARKRIQGKLREHALEHMFNQRNLVAQSSGEATFNPEKVHTARERWAEYVAGMGGGQNGEERAYQTVLEKMRGDFSSRFANGHQKLTGQPLQTVAVPLTHGDAHSIAALPADRRKEIQAGNASERARLQNRENGPGGAKFATDKTADKVDAQKQLDSMGESLFGGSETKTSSQQLDTHRMSLGNAAENLLGSIMPSIRNKRGTVAAGDIDMSSEDGVKRQRAIKQMAAIKRLGITMGVGSGKTAISLGAHSHLKAQGKVKRSLFAVPSVVQENFGNEASRFYDMASAGAPNWHADGNATPEERRAAYHQDSGHDICVVTHQALRDDLTWALAQHRFGGDEDKAREFLAAAPEVQRNAAMQAALDHHGWDFDMSVIDEGHNLLNRQGKANSGMANAIDAFTAGRPYHMSMSADPVKNDASEAFDFLRKVAPQRYVNDDHPDAGMRGAMSRAEFMRKYAANTPASLEALQREMAPYHYAESISPDVEMHTNHHVLELTPEQQHDYAQVHSMYQRARTARQKGTVDVEAVKSLSPHSFDNVPEAEQENVAARLQGSAGILRDTALDRVVNAHEQGAKLDWLEQRLGLQPSDHVAALDPTLHNPIIFAKSRAAVAQIKARLEKKGVRVATITGNMSGPQKEAQRLAYSPPWDDKAGRYTTEPTADVMIASDAGSVGWNGQRGAHVIQWDQPYTEMTHQQRSGRAYRVGQKRDVTVDNVLTNTHYERRRRARLEKKAALRQALTSPAELIDDSGLANRISQQTDAARLQLVRRSVNGDQQQMAA